MEKYRVYILHVRGFKLYYSHQTPILQWDTNPGKAKVFETHSEAKAFVSGSSKRFIEVIK